MLPLLESITQGASNTFLSKLMGVVTERFTLSEMTLPLTIAVVVAMVMSGLLLLVKAYYSASLVERIRYDATKKIYDSYLESDYSYFTSHKPGHMLSNMLGQTGSAAGFIQSFINFIFLIVNSIFLYAILLMNQFVLTLIMTVVFATIAALTNKTSRNALKRIGAKLVYANQNTHQTASESLASIRIVKLFGLESFLEKTLKKFLELRRRMFIKRQFYVAIPQAFVKSIIAISFGGIVLYYFLVSKQDLIDVLPMLAVFAAVSQRLSGAATSLSQTRLNLFSIVPSLQIVQDLINGVGMPKQISKSNGEIHFDKLKDDITFNDVTFAYEKGSKVYDHFNATIKKSKINIIDGPSGTGKTTLIDLLTRLYDPQTGQIMVNGIDLKKYDLRSWRRKIGVVSQEPYLFGISIKENIRLGNPDATDDEIVEAAKVANCHDFIVQFSDGYDTILGDRGETVSGGQRQRITIARAIARKPEIYIFDEATSALDNESERSIHESIMRLSKDSTIIVIAHRSTIKDVAEHEIRLESK
jgi:ABC-type multidrug transport system fused ATPase/permease subunit